MLADPLSYRGEKIRFVATSESSFEYVNLVDLNGNKLNIWPESQHELSAFLNNTGWFDNRGSDRNELQKSGPFEFTGYLEFRGGLWFTLYITEIYPRTNDPQANDNNHKLFAGYIDALAQDEKDIRAVISLWTAALKSGSVEKLKGTYSPDSSRYQSLFNASGADYVMNNKMDISILEMSIIIQGTNAYIKPIDVTVKPDKYFTPTGNLQVVGDGLYKLRTISLVKYNGEWKISNFDYSPLYVLPSISILTPP